MPHMVMTITPTLLRITTITRMMITAMATAITRRMNRRSLC
jgi:hypothetical protein